MLATGLHGGFLYAYANRIDETQMSVSKAEISLLDLPSISGTTTIDPKPMQRISPKVAASFQPAINNRAQRLSNSTKQTRKAIPNTGRDRAEIANIVNESQAAKSVQPDRFVQSKDVLPSITQAVSNASKKIAAVMNVSNQPRTVINEQAAKIIADNIVIPTKQPNSELLEPKSVEEFVTQTNTALPVKIAKNQRVAKLSRQNPLKQQDAKSVKLLKNVRNSSVIKEMTSRTQVPPRPSVEIAKTGKKTSKVYQRSNSIITNQPVKPLSVSRKSRFKIVNKAIAKPIDRRASTPSKRRVPVAIRPRRDNSLKKAARVARVMVEKSLVKIGSIKPIRPVEYNAKSSRISMSGNQVAMIARPNQIKRGLRPAPTKRQVNDFAKVVQFLKFHQSENRCFLAMPYVSKLERMQIIGFSNETNSWPTFQNAIRDNTKFDIPGRLISISDAQCQVVAFARQNKSYPSFSVSMDVAKNEIVNGTFVAGKMYINEGRYLNLYLVDDEGTAININRFVKIGKNISTFKMQVNLTSGEVKTSQLLLAIVTDELLASTILHDPIPASQLLKDIQDETTTKNLKLDMAISSFLVK